MVIIAGVALILFFIYSETDRQERRRKRSKELEFDLMYLLERKKVLEAENSLWKQFKVEDYFPHKEELKEVYKEIIKVKEEIIKWQ